MAADLGGPCALPVTAEIDRRTAPHRQSDHAVNLLAVADATQVFAPGRLLGVAEKIRPSDVVVMSEFAAPGRYLSPSLLRRQANR